MQFSDKGLPQYGLQHSIYEEPVKAHIHGQGPKLLSLLFPFVSDLRKGNTELGVHIRCDIRESEKKTQVRKQSNPTLSSKPLVYSHHYKLTFWEVHLFQLLSNNVRVPLSDNLKAQTWLGSRMAIIGAGM